MVSQDAPKILGIGNLHHFIFSDDSRRKRHILFFISVVINSDGSISGVRYLALTLREFKRSKLGKIPCDVGLDIGDIHITGKSQKITVVNGGYLETVRLTNSTLKRAIDRGDRLADKIDAVLVGKTNDFIVRYQGSTSSGARQIMHISASSPKYSVVYYPENPNIGLSDRSLNSREAFPCTVVTLAESDDFDRVIGRADRREQPVGETIRSDSWCVKILRFIKSLFE